MFPIGGWRQRTTAVDRPYRGVECHNSRAAQIAVCMMGVQCGTYQCLLRRGAVWLAPFLLFFLSGIILGNYQAHGIAWLLARQAGVIPYLGEKNTAGRSQALSISSFRLSLSA